MTLKVSDEVEMMEARVSPHLWLVACPYCGSLMKTNSDDEMYCEVQDCSYIGMKMRLPTFIFQAQELIDDAEGYKGP